MIGNQDGLDKVDKMDGIGEVDESDELESTDAIDVQTENVGETSVEIDVEELIAELEADIGSSSAPREGDPRKRLEKILEDRRAARELDEIDEFALESLD